MFKIRLALNFFNCFSFHFFAGFSPIAGTTRVNTRSVDQIGILVQTDLLNEYSSQTMDQIYNLLVHPKVRKCFPMNFNL